MLHSPGVSHVRGWVGAERQGWEDEEQVQFTEESDGRAEGAAVTKNVHPGDISQKHGRLPEKELYGKTHGLESWATPAPGPGCTSCALSTTFKVIF